MSTKDIFLIFTIIVAGCLFGYLIYDSFFRKKNFVINTETLNSKIKNTSSNDKLKKMTSVQMNNDIYLKELDVINKNKKIITNDNELNFQSLKDKYNNIDNPNNNDNKYQVLIVDDSNVSLMVAILALNEEHELFNIKTAKDGLEAWHKINNKKPDIIITDIDMPRWNGEKLIEKIKSSFPLSDIPIIVMTSNIKHQYKMFSNKKISGFFPKPLDDSSAFRIFIKRILSQ